MHQGHSDWINAVVFSPDDELLVSGSSDHTIKFWDLSQEICWTHLQVHAGWVTTVVFSPDDQLLASGSDDHVVKLWDPIAGNLRGTFEGHFGWVGTVVFSPDGQLLASDQVIAPSSFGTRSQKTAGARLRAIRILLKW